MVRHGDDLEAERQHVVPQPRLDDALGVDVVVLAVRQTAIEEAGDGAEGLQIGRDCQVVE